LKGAQFFLICIFFECSRVLYTVGWLMQYDHIFLPCVIAPMESGFCHAQIQRNEMLLACEVFVSLMIYRLTMTEGG
jgi:hypothetical protein